MSFTFAKAATFLALTVLMPTLAPNLSYAEGPPQPPATAPNAETANNAKIPDELKGVGITEHLGENVSIQDLTFKNEAGQDVKLAQYFKKDKPVALVLAYYGCPSLCTMVFNGLLDAMKPLEWTPGKQFEIVTVSIDSREKPKDAIAKKDAYIKDYGRPEGAEGWHFLTGEENQIKKLASEVGFGYRYVESTQEFAHGAAVFLLTPEGKISRILYGINYKTKDLRLALLEASSGKIGTIVDRFLLFCYRYDPHTRKYSMVLTKVMQAGSAGTVLVFGGYLAVFWRRQRRLGQAKES